MPYSKLSILNGNLARTGQNLISAEDDSSAEWRTLSPAYDQAVAHLIQEHDWNFATLNSEVERTDDSPDPNYEDEYDKPENCLHIIQVRVEDTVVDYRVFGDKILVTAGDDDTVTVEHVVDPGVALLPPMFVSALDCLMQAAIYRGLKRNEVEARIREKDAQAYLDKARTRSDQQQPARTLFRGTLHDRRRTRRG
jgi:hypothetical protein